MRVPVGLYVCAVLLVVGSDCGLCSILTFDDHAGDTYVQEIMYYQVLFSQLCTASTRTRAITQHTLLSTLGVPTS